MGNDDAKDPMVIPMILHCPECSGRHIDKGKFAVKAHHTHACQHCGFVWRPAVVATRGVQFLPGFNDEAERQDGDNDEYGPDNFAMAS